MADWFNPEANQLCKACGYNAPLKTYMPTASVYSDVCCPNCGSTNNAHNAEYLRRLQERWTSVDAK